MNRTHAQEMRAESHAPYVRVWCGLLLFTVAEYGYALAFKDRFVALVAGLVLVAVIKAGLVGWYFMHLKFDWRWASLLLLPAVVLATVLICALVPDMAFPLIGESPAMDQGTSSVAPAVPKS